MKTKQNRKMTKKEKLLAEKNMDLLDLIINSSVKSGFLPVHLRDEAYSELYLTICACAMMFDDNEDFFRFYCIAAFNNEILKIVKRESKFAQYCPIEQDNLEFINSIPYDADKLAFVEAFHDMYLEISPESQEIFQLMCKGYTKKDISDRLNMSYTSINRKVQNIKASLKKSL